MSQDISPSPPALMGRRADVADILPDDLVKRSSGELLEACGRLQEAYTAALEREVKERETATIRLRREAEKLATLLGPENPPSGNLTSLRAACKMTPQDLVEKQAEVTELVLRSLCAVAAVAHSVVLIGAEQAR